MTGHDQPAAQGRMIFRFVLARERWNWPVEGEDSIRAFRELLQRAGITYVVVPAVKLPEVESHV